MKKVRASILLDKLLKLESKTDEEVQKFFEDMVQKQMCWKYNKGDLALVLLGVISEGKRIRATFYTDYSIPRGLGSFVSDVFDGNYPTRVAYLTYKTWTGARWIDLIIRPKKDYSKTDYVYFLRIGIDEEGKLVDEEKVKELLDFVGERL